MPSRVLSSISRRSLASTLVALALAAGLAACGSAGSSSATTASTSGAQFQARLDLAKCFRAHGINVPDPTSGGGPAGGGGIFRELRQYSQAQVTAARQACNQYFAKAFPALNLSPAQRAQAQQQLVKFAQCMRSHGIDVPDPTTTGTGLRLQARVRLGRSQQPRVPGGEQEVRQPAAPVRSRRPRGRRGRGRRRRCSGCLGHLCPGSPARCWAARAGGA